MKTGISYFGVRNPRHVKKDLEEVKQNNITSVVHTFSENDKEYYLDTMKEIVNLTQEMGLEVYIDPWGVARIFGGEAYSKFIAMNDDARQVTKEGKKGYGACMNNPLTEKFIGEWLEAARYIGADYIFWDEPHFSPFTNKEGCFCDICRDIYKRERGGDLLKAGSEELRWMRGYTKLNFLKKMIRKAHEMGIKNALCVLPYDRDVDWEKLAGIPELDVFGTDPYWFMLKGDFEEETRNFAKKVAELSKKYGKEGQIWIQGFRVKKGEEWKVRRVAEIAYEEGIRNLASWSFRGTEYMSYIRSENPELVWKTLGEVYGELLEKDGNP